MPALELAVMVVAHAALTVCAYVAGVRHGCRFAESEIRRRILHAD